MRLKLIVLCSLVSTAFGPADSWALPAVEGDGPTPSSRFLSEAAVARAVEALPQGSVGGGGWAESFDGYSSGSGLIGQGGWQGWDGSPASDAIVSPNQAQSPPNSVELTTNSDVVQSFVGIVSGQWDFVAWSFIPGPAVGQEFLVMLNTYDPGIAYNWSLQVLLDANSGLVIDNVAGGNALPLIRDTWVPIEVQIDLDADTQSVFYNGQFLYTDTWTGHVTGSGIPAIAALDLFSNGAQGLFWDDLLLRPVPNGHLVFDGLPHRPLGSADLNLDEGGHLVVSNIGSSGKDGVSIDLGEAEGLDFFLELPSPSEGAALTLTKLGSLDGTAEQVLTTMQTTVGGGREIFFPDFTPLGASTYTVEAYLNGVLVAQVAGLSGPDVDILPSAGLFGNLFKPRKADPPCPKWNKSFDDGDVEVFIEGLGPILVDAIVWIPDGLGGVEGSCGTDFVSEIRIQAADFESLVVSRERLDLFAHEHEALGGAEFDAENGHLVVSNIGSSGLDGVSIDLGESETFQIEWDAIPSPPAGSSIEFQSTGRFGGGPEAPLGTLRIETIVEGVEEAIRVDYTPVGSATHQVEILNNHVPVFTLTGHSGDLVAVPRCELNYDWRPKCCIKGRAIIDGQATACYTIVWTDPIPFQIYDAGVPLGSPIEGDRLRILAENPIGEFEAINSLSILLTDYGPIEILEEESVELPPVAGIEQEEGRFTSRLDLSVSGNPLRLGGLAAISFSLPADGHADLSVFNARGRKVDSLVHGETAAGSYVQPWDGRDESGRRLSSGVYYLQLTANGNSGRERLVIVR